MKHDLPWFISQHAKKQEELIATRKKARLINKELKQLEKIITANMKDMVLTGSKEQMDDQNFGWVYRAAEELEKEESAK